METADLWSMDCQKAYLSDIKCPACGGVGTILQNVVDAVTSKLTGEKATETCMFCNGSGYIARQW